LSFKRILVTGGMGFIGSNLIRYLLHRYDYTIVNLDKVTYAGNPANLADLSSHPNYCFIRGDIACRRTVRRVFNRGVDLVVNLAAETHVDRSINDSAAFVRTNVAGTQNLLEAARCYGVKGFVQVSTDEVYGSLGEDGRFDEGSPLKPNNPYAASKAGADCLARAYHRTYGLPVMITRCSNNYGPYQYPEKFIPLLISNALAGRPLPLYGDGQQVRDWIHVEDHCRALDAVMHGGKPGEVYNIGGGGELSNLQVAMAVLELLGKPADLITFVPDRPGHDRRYAIDATKIATELQWFPLHSFQAGLQATVRWYQAHPEWCNPELGVVFKRRDRY